MGDGRRARDPRPAEDADEDVLPLRERPRSRGEHAHLPDLPLTARGATVGFTINFLRLAVASDLTATATVRRRGGTLSTGEVTVVNDEGAEVAMAVVTYKLDAGRIA